MDAKHTLGEPRALISRVALLRNARTVRQAVAPGVKICAMLKADAYGHGVSIVLDALCNFQQDDAESPAVDALGVASVDEAAALPQTTLPVLIFRPVENTFLGRQRDAIESAIRNGWVLSVCSSGAADDVARIAMHCGKRANVQVMIDTGMTRCGVAPELADAILSKIAAHASLKLHGVCTHFACAETRDHPLNLEQLDRFHVTANPILEKRFQGSKLLRHAANSGAVFFVPQSHLDMVRPGLSLFGIDPTGKPSTDRALIPAMKWTAPLISIRDLKRGGTVGYGQTWIAPRDTRIGLIPIGYADGYWRSFSNRAVVIVGGKPAPVVGRVSMDLMTIDLGDVPHATLGDEVTLLDNDPLSPASVYQLAKWADTIPYEIFCRIGSRVKRVAIEPEDAARIAGNSKDETVARNPE